MKIHSFIYAIAACLLLPAAADAMAADTDDIRLISQSESYVADSSGTVHTSGSASFMYNDEEGRLTCFSMERQGSALIITIRQFDAVVWKKAIFTDSSNFGVTRHTEGGHTWFLITAGRESYRVEPDMNGSWHSRPLKSELPDTVQLLS